MAPQPVDDNISDARQNLRSIRGSHAAAVFAEAFVANPVQAVLDSPMTAPPFHESRRIGPVAADTRDRILHFGRGHLIAGDRSRESADLPRSRPPWAGPEDQIPLQIPGILEIPGISLR